MVRKPSGSKSGSKVEAIDFAENASTFRFLQFRQTYIININAKTT
jgi:hypothetical protein